MIFTKHASLSSALTEVAQGSLLAALAGFVVRDLDLPALFSFEHSQEPLVVLAAALGAVVGITRFRRALVAIAAALGLLWGIVAFTPLSSWLAQGLVRREMAEPADAVFVSFAGLRPGAQRTTEAQNRALHAADLLARGKAPRIVAVESSLLAGVGMVRESLGRLGVEGEVVVAGRGDTTREEALAVAAAARERTWKLLLVVTSPIHSRRACAALEKEGLTVVCIPSLDSRFQVDELDTSAERLAAFGSIIHERLGIWIYARRGWLPR